VVIGNQRIAAVVVTYQRTAILRDCLKKLNAQSRPLDEIIVVDNGAPGDTGKMLLAEFPDVTYLAMPDNLGAPAGYAAGMRLAYGHGADWAWVFNDDNFTEPAALQACLDVVQARPAGSVKIVAPWHQIGERIQKGYLWKRGPVPVDQPTGDPYPVDLVLLGAALISSTVLEQVGYPREDYFIGFWEWEYCLRTRGLGGEIWVAPEIGVLNLAAGSSGTSPPWRLYYQTRNHLRTVLDRRSPDEVAWWMGRLLKMMVAITFRRGQKRDRLRMRLLGAWHGLIGKMGKTIDPATLHGSRSKRQVSQP
jgi:GT2 family glycosyltransferase